MCKEGCNNIVSISRKNVATLDDTCGDISIRQFYIGSVALLWRNAKRNVNPGLRTYPPGPLKLSTLPNTQLEYCQILFCKIIHFGFFLSQFDYFQFFLSGNSGSFSKVCFFFTYSLLLLFFLLFCSCTLCTGAVAASAVVVDHRFCNNNFTKKISFVIHLSALKNQIYQYNVINRKSCQ